MLAWYTKQLATRPLVTGMWSTAAILFTGDTIAQQLIERRAKHDWVRTVRMTAMGGLVVGPTLRTWYLCLDKMFGGGMMLSTVVKKLVTDQGCFAPCFVAIFISLNNLLQGKSMDDIQGQLRSDYINILIANWLFWAPCQVLNFSLVPLQHRLMFANMAALVWNTFLAWKANSPTGEQVKEVAVIGEKF